jgi:hypothetical protein
MEFYSATKNEILSFADKWMELKNIILSEVSQFRRPKSHIFSHMWNIDLIQIQQCYEKAIHTEGRSHTRKGMVKEGS